MNSLKEKAVGLTPIEISESFFPDEIYLPIISERHRYAKECKNDANFELTVGDLKSVIGFLLLTSYNVLPSKRYYWPEDGDLGQNVVRKSMTRTKNCKIKSYLLFN